MRACKHCGSPDMRYCAWPGDPKKPNHPAPCEMESLGYEVEAPRRPTCLPLVGAVTILFWAGMWLAALWLAGFLRGST